MLHTKETHLQLQNGCVHAARDRFPVSLSVLSLVLFRCTTGLCIDADTLVGCLNVIWEGD